LENNDNLCDLGASVREILVSHGATGLTE
jgi:hypothetical protein